MAIYFFNEEVEFVLQNKTKYKNWFREIANSEKKSIGKVNIIFTSDELILKINKTYLNHDYFTDIITFDDSVEDQLNGDLYISIDSVKSNANEYHCSFDLELSRVMVHGILHLVGYSDSSENSQIEMRKKENVYIQRLYSYYLIS